MAVQTSTKDRSSLKYTAPATLSPSSAATYRQCPLRWKYKYLEKLPEPSGRPAIVGNFIHKVLENFMKLDPVERTMENAKTIAREEYDNKLSQNKSYLELNLNDAEEFEFRWEAWGHISGLWNIEDPATVQVQDTEKKLKVQLGEVNFVGIVDRIDIEAKSTVIVDYKSGKLPNMNQAKDEKLNQIFLYAAAWQALENKRPAEVRLYFPNPSNAKGGTAICEPVTQELIDNATKNLETTNSDIQSSLENEEFKASPGPLCGWCHYVDRCEKGAKEVTTRYSGNRMNQNAPAVKILGLNQ